MEMIEGSSTYWFGYEWRDLEDYELCDCSCSLNGWTHQWKRGIKWREVEQGLRLPDEIPIDEKQFVVGVDKQNSSVLQDMGWKNLKFLDSYLGKIWLAKDFSELTNRDEKLIKSGKWLDYLSGAYGF